MKRELGFVALALAAVYPVASHAAVMDDFAADLFAAKSGGANYQAVLDKYHASADDASYIDSFLGRMGSYGSAADIKDAASNWGVHLGTVDKGSATAGDTNPDQVQLVQTGPVNNPPVVSHGITQTDIDNRQNDAIHLNTQGIAALIPVVNKQGQAIQQAQAGLATVQRGEAAQGVRNSLQSKKLDGTRSQLADALEANQKQGEALEQLRADQFEAYQGMVQHQIDQQKQIDQQQAALQAQLAAQQAQGVQQQARIDQVAQQVADNAKAAQQAMQQAATDTGTKIDGLQQQVDFNGRVLVTQLNKEIPKPVELPKIDPAVHEAAQSNLGDAQHMLDMLTNPGAVQGAAAPAQNPPAAPQQNVDVKPVAGAVAIKPPVQQVVIKEPAHNVINGQSPITPDVLKAQALASAVYRVQTNPAPVDQLTPTPIEKKVPQPVGMVPAIPAKIPNPPAPTNQQQGSGTGTNAPAASQNVLTPPPAANNQQLVNNNQQAAAGNPAPANGQQVQTVPAASQPPAVAQVQTFDASALETRLESEIKAEDQKIEKVNQKAMNGIAGAMAMGALKYVDLPNSFAAGVGDYDKGQAIAVGYQHSFNSQRVAVQAAATKGGNYGVAASYSLGW